MIIFLVILFYLDLMNTYHNKELKVYFSITIGLNVTNLNSNKICQ